MSETQTKSACLECDAPLAIAEDIVIGEVVPCGECGVEMEVASLEPMQLEMAPEIEEDWGE